MRACPRESRRRSFASLRPPFIRHRDPRGISLVEVLVTIAILGVLIALLVPTVSNVKQHANSTRCQTNLRSIWLAAMQYSDDHRGALPWGFTWNRTNYGPGGTPGDPADPRDTRWIAWFTLLDKYHARGKHAVVANHAGQNFSSIDVPVSAAFRCPDVGEPFAHAQVHYYNNGAAMPHVRTELNPVNGEGARFIPRRPNGELIPTAPARTTRLYPDTALFWDTALVGTLEPTQPAGFYEVDGGWCIPPSFLDAGFAFLYPHAPQSRYRPNGFAPWLNPPRFSVYDNVAPVSFPSDAQMRAWNLPHGDQSFNADTPGGALVSYKIGAPRFRHYRDTRCNVAFADGSIRELKLDRTRTFRTPEDPEQAENYVTEFTRGMYRLKWPTDRSPTPARYP